MFPYTFHRGFVEDLIVIVIYCFNSESFRINSIDAKDCILIIFKLEPDHKGGTIMFEKLM